MERPENSEVESPMTARELIDQMFEQHDREVHRIFARLMGVEEQTDGAA